MESRQKCGEAVAGEAWGEGDLSGLWQLLTMCPDFDTYLRPNTVSSSPQVKCIQPWGEFSRVGHGHLI